MQFGGAAGGPTDGMDGERQQRVVINAGLPIGWDAGKREGSGWVNDVNGWMCDGTGVSRARPRGEGASPVFWGRRSATRLCTELSFTSLAASFHRASLPAGGAVGGWCWSSRSSQCPACGAWGVDCNRLCLPMASITHPNRAMIAMAVPRITQQYGLVFRDVYAP